MSTVATLHPEYERHQPIWERTIAACNGEDAVKELPDALPYLNKQDTSPENVARNRAYRERAVYFNAVGRTLEGLVGMAFRRDPDIEVGTSARVRHILDDATGDGVSIYQLAQKTLAGVLQTGRHGVLTDLDDRGMPRIVAYRAKDIINWRAHGADGGRKLGMLVLRETEDEVDGGGYGVKTVTRYREYRVIDRQVHVILWREVDGHPVEVSRTVLANSRHNESVAEIPFSFVGATDNSYRIERAPLADLALMNLAHFRDSADHQDSVFFCGQVQPWIAGLDQEWRDWLADRGLYMGSRAPMLLPDGGRMGFEQAQPNSMVRQAMKDKEEMMVALGARLIEQGAVTKTATQAMGDQANANSVLSLCVANVSEAFTAAIQRCYMLTGERDVSDDLIFAINGDFTERVADPQMITAIVDAWQRGAFARSDMLANLKRWNIVAPERDDDEIAEEVAQELPDDAHAD